MRAAALTFLFAVLSLPSSGAGEESVDPACPPGATRREEASHRGRSIRCVDPAGRNHGPFVFVAASGVVLARGEYEAGRQVGWERKWNEQGELIREREYRGNAWFASRRVPSDVAPRASRPGDPVHPCPDGAVVAGATPPAGFAQWCEKVRDDGAYVRHGPWVGFGRRDGDTYVYRRESYRDGLRDGMSTEYWQDGTPKREEHHAAGTRMPPSTSWYRNGVVAHREVSGPEAGQRTRTHFENDGMPISEVVLDATGGTVRRTFWHPTGKKRLDESWANGRTNGIQREWWPNGTLRSERERRDGDDVGTWKEWSPTGALMSVRKIEDRVHTSQFYFVWPQSPPDWAPAPVARGPGRAEAKPIACEPPSRRVEIPALALGVAELCVIADGEVSFGLRLGGSEGIEEEFRGGERHGRARHWSDRGELVGEETFRHDRRHGRSIRWRDDGSIEAILDYEDGEPHGIVARWHETGARSDLAQFTRGERDGLLLYYDPTGRLYEQRSYRAGLLDGTSIEFADDGSKRSEKEYRANKLDGRAIKWSVTGLPVEETTYRDGIPHGPYRRWRRGQVAEEGAYTAGRKTGVWTSYDFDGSVRKRTEHPTPPEPPPAAPAPASDE